MPKPTFASVTDLPCTCPALKRLVNDPRSPIVFDGQMNEFHLEYPLGTARQTASVVIYHCFFCGGVASESKR